MSERMRWWVRHKVEMTESVGEFESGTLIDDFERDLTHRQRELRLEEQNGTDLAKQREIAMESLIQGLEAVRNNTKVGFCLSVGSIKDRSLLVIAPEVIKLSNGKVYSHVLLTKEGFFGSNLKRLGIPTSLLEDIECRAKNQSQRKIGRRLKEWFYLERPMVLDRIVVRNRNFLGDDFSVRRLTSEDGVLFINEVAGQLNDRQSEMILRQTDRNAQEVTTMENVGKVTDFAHLKMKKKK